MAALRNTLSYSLLTKVRSICTLPALHQKAVLQASSNGAAITDIFDDLEQKKVSQAMKAYMERAKAHSDFMKQQLEEFNIGKRHLANMMGKDPEFFTQADIDEAIRYLFPSGLYDPKARPMMKHPEELYPKRKAAEFDIYGRPHHSMFYTAKPNYFKALHDVADKFKKLDKKEDTFIKKGVLQPPVDDSFIFGSEWLTIDKIELNFLEKLSDEQYSTLIKALERLSRHPYAYLEKDFILKFRRPNVAQAELQSIPELVRDESGRPYAIHEARRKWAKATVKVIGQGTGRIQINNHSILYFRNRQSKEQVLFPLEFTDLLGKVDVEATVSGGGHCGQAGAIRLGISMCLRAFVDAPTMERMRLAGLLSFDPRKRERKKPGQPGARKKPTWKRR